MSDMQHDPNRDYDDDGFDNAPIYDEGARRRLSTLTRVIVITAIMVAGVAIAGLAWFFYNEGVRSGAEEAAPVLRAEGEVFKRKPEDPGGMEIPHQDKLVYDRIAPGQAQQPVERLLPPPETPVERPTPKVEVAPEAPEVGAGEPMEAVKEMPEPVQLPEKPEGASVAQAIREATEAAMQKAETSGKSETPLVRAPERITPPPAPEPAPEPAPQVAAKPAPAPPPPAPKAPAPKTPAIKAPAAVGWRIQLASVTSDAGARREWDRLQTANKDLLGALALDVQQAKLPKGTFYRIQAGPLADRAAAGALCAKLKSRKQDCLVVAP